MAFSTSDNPDSPWNVYNWNHFEGELLWFDGLGLSVSEGQAYLTGNLRDDLGRYSGNYMYAMGKAAGYRGVPLGGVTWRDLPGDSIIPVPASRAQLYGPGHFFVSTISTGGESVFLYHLTADITDFHSLDRYTIDIPRYQQAASAAQMGTNQRLDVGDCRIRSAYYQNGRVYFAFTQDSGDGFSGISFNRIRLSTMTAKSTLIAARDCDYAYPAIANRLGNELRSSTLLVFQSSGPQRFPDIRAKLLSDQMEVVGTVRLKKGDGANNSDAWGRYIAVQRKYGTNRAWVAGHTADDSNAWSTRLIEVNLPVPTLSVIPTQPTIEAISAGELREYPSPLNISVARGVGWDEGNVQDIKTWVTLDGTAPSENPPNGRVINDGHSLGTPEKIKIESFDRPGLDQVNVRAKTFCTSFRTRIEGATAVQTFNLYRPGPGVANLTASNDNPDAVILRWGPPIFQADTFDVFTSYSNEDPLGPSVKLNAAPIVGSAYRDARYAGSGASVPYYVRETLLDGRIRMASGPVIGTYALPALKIGVSQEGNTVRLIWSYPSWHSAGDFEIQFLIYRSLNKEFDQATLLFTNKATKRVVAVGTRVVEVPVAAEASYYDKAVAAGERYYYWVIASTEYQNVKRKSPPGHGVDILVKR